MGLDVTIQKRFGRGFALDVSLATETGAPLGILGASGSGKSVTLKCIAGIETPDQGRITLDDRILFDSAARVNRKPQVRRVGCLFQHYALFPHMRVAQNIACGMGKAADRETISRLLARFSLGSMEDRFPLSLSGGEQQRVALARILASKPEVLLLDEPFSALDAPLRESLQFDLKALLRDFREVVLVTHNPDEVYRLCPRLLVLDGGRVIARGETAAIFKKPPTRQTAHITGCKNISRIHQAGPRQVEAIDWGLKLDTAEPVEARHRHVGIRAHELIPVPGLVHGSNVFEVSVLDCVEDVFEWNIRVSPKGGQDLTPLWWKVSKSAYSGTPAYLAVPPESLLLLEE